MLAFQEWTTQHWHDFVHDDTLKESLIDFVEKVRKLAQTSESIEQACALIKEQANRQVLPGRCGAFFFFFSISLFLGL